MARFDTRMHPPPVRLSRSNAQRAMNKTHGAHTNVLHTAKGAGNYGQKERRFASAPVQLRIDKSAGPNIATARGAAIPIGVTRRKRGFPAVTTLPTAPAFPAK
jgi:hypothetical protein